MGNSRDFNRSRIYTAMLNSMVPEQFRVRHIRKETQDVVTIELKPLNSSSFSFQPGQFNMLYSFGKGEVPISISGNPVNGAAVIHTIRNVGKVTTALCALKKEEVIGIRGPFGKGWPVLEAKGKDILIAAGGIGLAPLRPVIYHLLINRKDYGNIFLLYGTRTPDDIIYSRELAQWRGRLDLTVEVTVDTAGSNWHGHVGVVTTLIPRIPISPIDTTAMICGPEIMIKFTVQELLKRGINMEDIFLSLERNMKCGIGLCGHCQLGPVFVCKDGPVVSYDRVKDIFGKREI